ncbi:TonB-dependent hemoglobin/transferrin/lactoferrin family receptor [Xanthobacter dioxanivorans]|uniref:TonB-dependent hemoglobin/transferrin/lactoferrin family receptor n=1 Tax=Xanthobacter dioxanivorans TaxID=2528964 RepID=A0A974PLW9_9HYPH|nr:TonB-dependent hemoglobin/transferrin/lactoferrin family receptor [Xanthobacter dioxanivorans]QRG05599.1 TonB-dependent hemoglobin/transferrin/lactoferrin family receptor [Xanthobacter dioxanivorans]
MARRPHRTGVSAGISNRTRGVLRSGVAASALLLATGGAFAQSAPAATDPSADTGSQVTLDTITVAATLTEERTIDTLAAVSVVRPDDLIQFMPDRVQDVFFGMPGTTVIQNGNSPQAAINIRGLQDFGRVAVFVDGARQNFTQLGHGSGAGTFFLEPGLLADVDVVRGPVSNIYGSGAIGGVVTFRTKDADDIIKKGQAWGVESTGEFGSNGPMGYGALFGAARVGQNIDLFFGGTYRAQNDYEDGDGNVVPGSGYDTWTGTAKATFRPADFHEVKISALNYSADYTTYNAALVNNDVPASATQYGTTVLNQTVTGSYNYSNPDDNVFDWRSSIYWNRVKQDQLKVAGTPSSITGAIGDPRTFTINTVGFDANNTSRFNWSGIRNAITVGGDYFHDDVDNVDNYGFGEGYNPNGERGVGGAFVQWKANYSTWLEAQAAVRYDTYNLSGDGVSTDGDRFSPKATVGVTPWSWVTVYGTYAEGYRAPAITETLVSGAHPPNIPLVFCPDGSYGVFCFVPNPYLKPEVGKNKEIGLNLKFDDIFTKGDKFRAKANVYRNDVEDYIELVGYNMTPFGTYADYQYQNIANARLQGFEFESNYDAGSWFAGFNATVSDGENVDNGQPLANVMPSNIATTLGARFLENKLTVSVRWQWVAAKTAADLPTDSPYEPTPSFNLVNFYVGYQPSENLLASLSVENLLNEQYVQYQQFLPSAGLTVKGGLKIRFGADTIAAATPSPLFK